jgi:hypothetical protein
LNPDVQEHTFLAREGLKVHGSLIGLDFSEEHTFIYGIAQFGMPLRDDPFGHRVAQAGHCNN